MATVLRNVGLNVTEHLVHEQKRRTTSRAAFAVLLPGLARGCSNDAYMNTVLRTCSSGAADMTLLLQFGNESKQSAHLLDFDLCRQTLHRLGTTHKNCSFVFVRQQFQLSLTQSCDTKPGRVEMQALSIGRAYEWSQHVFGEHRFYVRVRLDDSAWCLPSLANLPAGDAWFVVDGLLTSIAPDGSRVRMFSDRYALVPAELAHAYFEAWRVWSVMDCTHPCHAGHGLVDWGAHLSMRAWAPQGTRQPYKWSPWSMVGECVVTTWLETHMAARNLTLYRAGGGAGNALFKMHNATHVRRREPSPVAVEEWLHYKELTGPRVHDMTAICHPEKDRAERRPLVQPPLPTLNKGLSCQGHGVLGLCDALNITIDGAAIVEWALLLLLLTTWSLVTWRWLRGGPQCLNYKTRAPK